MDILRTIPLRQLKVVWLVTVRRWLGNMRGLRRLLGLRDLFLIMILFGRRCDGWFVSLTMYVWFMKVVWLDWRGRLFGLCFWLDYCWLFLLFGM